MSTYVARTDVQLKPLEIPSLNTWEPGTSFVPNAVYELEGGDLIAVYYLAKRTPTNSLSCHIVAWMIDVEGDAQQSVDFAGVPIKVEFKHNASAAELRSLGADGLALKLVDLITGNLPIGPAGPDYPWPMDVRDEVNIANAIVVAKATGPVSDLSTVAPGGLPA